jgi:hypothetical protein
VLASGEFSRAVSFLQPALSDPPNSKVWRNWEFVGEFLGLYALSMLSTDLRSVSRTLLATLAAFVAAWLLLGLPLDKPDSGIFQVDEAEYLTLAVHSVRQARGLTDASVGGQIEVRDGAAPWRAGIHESTFGFQSPGLPKLLFGLAGSAAGAGEVNPKVFPRFADPSLSKGPAKLERKAAAQAVLPALGAGRAVTRLLAAAIAALLFALAAGISRAWTRPLGSYATGALAAALWLSAPIAWEASAHVRPGLMPVAFWCAGLAAALGIRRPGILPISLALGLACGLATAGKLNGILFAPLVPALLYWNRRAIGIDPGPALRQAAIGTLISAAVCIAAFLALAPGLWHDTISGMGSVLNMWNGDLAFQAQQTNLSVEVSTGAADSLAMGFRGLFTTAGPLAGLVPYLGAVLLPLGLLALARGSRARPDAPAQTHRDRAVLAWALVLLLASAWLMPLDRPRYILPMVAPAALVEALVLARLLTLRKTAAPAASNPS